MIDRGKMKICVFCHDAYMSGATMALYDWVSCDNENNYLIVLPHDNKKSLFYNLNNVRVMNGHYYILVKELKKTRLSYKIKKVVKFIYNLSFKKMYRKKIKEKILIWKPDIIISNSFAVLDGAEIAIDLGIEHIWHVREFMELDHQITHYNVSKVNNLVRHSNAIYISNAIKNYYERKYDFKSFVIIYDQVNTLIIDNYREYFTNNTIRMISVGILQPNKGHLEAIKIAEKINEKGYKVQMDIYGEGDYYSELNKYLFDHNIEYVKIKGYCNKLNVERLKYDVGLICSKNEAFGRVTIESMGAKNITVASNAGASTEIIRNAENGFLYTSGDIVEGSNLIIDIFNKKYNVQKITKNAVKTVREKYSKPIYTQICSYADKICSKDRLGDQLL